MSIKNYFFLKCFSLMNQYMALICLLFCGVNESVAQKKYSIKGNFRECKEVEVRLIGYEGTKERLLYQTQTDTKGNVTLDFPQNYVGAARLQIKDRTSVHVILNHENVEIIWSKLDKLDSLHFLKSDENQWFQKGVTINNEAQNKLLGLKYLIPLYQKQEDKKLLLEILQAEVQDQSQQLNTFVAQLPKISYANKYLAYRAILQEFQTNSKNTNVLQAPEKGLLGIDYGEMGWYYSGMIQEVFDEYLSYILKVSSKEAIVANCKVLNERVKIATKDNAVVLNDYSEYLIKQYERYGLTEVAEAFALSLLADDKCFVDDKRTALFEQYRKMAIGKLVPNIPMSGNNKYKNLFDLQSKYKVIVFGASWCEACEKEIPQLKEYTDFFKSNYEAEIVFFALDTDKVKYDAFKKDLPFTMSCDFKGWEGAAVNEYFVFASPTFYIVDKYNKIVAKPHNSVEAAAWLFKNQKNEVN
ncbi:TlpA family protein disulfide reductase [Flavobacterium succinicans]|uniref:Thiol-disulfide oxidoreductase ResA n=1 Tax=Flavobacterium succinicans TaxID=29536 RepID=A0A199XTH2_9FLAO|nr:thioredoxin family protein [Flavobacterium succinicans]OAZ04541.1 thiol-disulfide oxidoreductase ResA [Flavobacterium succinicans]